MSYRIAVLAVLTVTLTFTQPLNAEAQAPLRLASTPWAPFTDVPGRPRLALDIVEEALALAGVHAETTIVADGTLVPAIVGGAFDGSAALWRDGDRERALVYSRPYLENRLVLVGPAGGDVSAGHLAALAGKRVALVEGYAYGEDTTVSGPVWVRSRGLEDSVRLVLSGEADYALMDALVAATLARHHGSIVAARLAIGRTPLVSRTLHVAIRRDRPGAHDVIARLDSAFAQLITTGRFHGVLGLDWLEADSDGDGLPEIIAAHDEVGSAPPEDPYVLLAPSRPTALPRHARRYVIDGQLYVGWDAVPARYKRLPTAGAVTTATRGPAFAFDWTMAAPAPAETFDVATLPAGTMHRLPVSRVEVRGVRLYDARSLVDWGLTSLSRPSPSPDDIASRLRTLYREDGFFLADVQAVLDPARDTLSIRATEGNIGGVTVEGLRRPLSRRVASYFGHVGGDRPAHRDAFERALMLASDLAGVDVRGEFHAPSDAPAAELRLVGRELRQAGSLSFDTVPLASGTAVRGYLLQQVNSPLRGGDTLRVMGFGAVEPDGAHSLVGTAYYRSPIGSRGTYVEARGGNAFARREYRDIALSSDLRGVNAAAGVGHPIRRNLHEYLYAIGEYEWLDARSTFGSSSPVSSTSQSGRLTMVYGYTASSGALTQVSATATAGRGPVGDTGRDEGFAHLRMSAGTLVPLGQRTVQRFEVMAQPWASPLPVVEHLFLGYGPYLRGFPVIEFQGERGLKGTAELSHALVAAGRDGGAFELVPSVFVDFGYASSRDVVAPYAARAAGLASAGVGLRMALPGRLFVSGWVATAISDGPQTPAGKTRAGIQVTRGW